MNWKKLSNKKGTITSLWFSSLPIYFILFGAILTLVGLWISMSSLRVAGDAASVAVSKKLDELLHDEIERKMDEAFDNGHFNSYEYVLGTEKKKRDLLQEVIKNKKGQLTAAAKKYLKKNNAAERGVLIFDGKDGRVKVQAKRSLDARVFEDALEKLDVIALGRGAKRSYLEWLGDGEPFEITFP
ncbi:hypothetical protein [Baia soyae]|uniref:Flp pilus-assembly TadE/G-like protein n=1 Tax=Baia soyae TaxID=1544746 RepID=A0A4V2SY89_9BACL|nr:hypothetical protein [Baia soyae]TCP69231.1 hypothetical protein EDD57_11128 [Baia soyae]